MRRRRSFWTLLVVAVIAPATASPASDYYVATDGSDSASGKLDEPFRTIQRRITQLKPGDTLFVRGGSYHERIVVSGLNGSPDKPITITNFDDDRVVLDGRVAITGQWRRHKGDIYKTTVGQEDRF